MDSGKKLLRPSKGDGVMDVKAMQKLGYAVNTIMLSTVVLSVDKWIQQIDAKLYTGKKTGKNRVVL